MLLGVTKREKVDIWIISLTFLGYLNFILGQTGERSSKGEICVFPFKYKGRLYTSCITTDYDTLWCATTNNYDKDKTWTECNAAFSTTSKAEGLYNLPKFDETTETNITAYVGDRVRLPCTINNLGKKQITWQRKGRPYPLTISTNSFFDKGKYIAEQYDSNQWNLIISDVEKADSGAYLCKITTRLMRMEKEVYLTVKETQPNGLVKRYVEEGTTLKLICNSTYLERVDGQRMVYGDYIQWYRNDKKIDSNARNGIMILNEIRGKEARSTLTIEGIKSKHLGTYHCASLDKTNAKFIISFKDSQMSKDQPLDTRQQVPEPSVAELVNTDEENKGNQYGSRNLLLVVFSLTLSAGFQV